MNGIRKRRRINPLERKAFIKIWGMKCAYCESHKGPFYIDHIVPYSQGGSCDLENLCLACLRCNSRKSASPLPKLYEGLLLAIAKRNTPNIRRLHKSMISSIKTPAEAVFGSSYVRKYLTRRAVGCTTPVTNSSLLEQEMTEAIRKYFFMHYSLHPFHTTLSSAN